MNKATFEIPEQKSIIGNLLAVNAFEYHSKTKDEKVTAHALLMKAEDGQAIEIVASQDVTEIKSGDKLFVTFETRVANITGYMTAAGAELHTNGGHSAIGFTKL